MHDVDATIVIPAYRRTEPLRKAVESVIRQDYPADRYEVIVVDSSPDQANVQMVAELAQSSPCRLRAFHKAPEGPGPSRNRGAAESRGAYIAFMDSDCVASPKWLQQGLAAFEPDVGLVQGRTIPEPGVPLGIFTHYILVEEESFLYETANVIYRKAAFEQCGGFPADLSPRAITPIGGEDVFVAWSVKRAGWKSRFARGAIVYHEVIPIPKKDWVFIRRLFIYPRMLRQFPELRQFLCGGLFLDKPQMYFGVGLIGTLGVVSSPWLLLAWIPYWIYRSMEPTRSLKGLLRLIRPIPYLMRDTASFGILAAGSLRYRSLVL